uniref:Uncharacterized protein n=1 Tax=Ananas comosus var. bracteatus TaxID=296719 RepID=A0A6V7NG37_ANACO|nr:unnamed protein product [Ananas comosus var. bracteatus]
MRPLHIFLVLGLTLVPVAVHAGCDCAADEAGRDKSRARPLKIAAFFSILVCGSIGCLLPMLGRRVPLLRPETDVFFVVKAFAAGVILATGFIHILPDAFDKLTSSCLPDSPWQDFPFAGFGAMVAAIATLVVDTLATGYFNRMHYKQQAGARAAGRNGLGGCIVQAKFKLRSIVTMVLSFSLTTPVGILIGIGISSVYNENSPKALIVEGVLNSVAAGILVYMALVDLLAEDFMNPKVQGKAKLQLAINVSLLLGAGLMSLLAKWA